MNLNYCIVHELVKEPGQTTAQLLSSEALMTIDSALEALMSDLNRRFSASRLHLARFDESPGKLFPLALEAFMTTQGGHRAPQNSARDEEAFLRLSHQLMGHLQTLMQGKVAARGGYLLFASYDDEEEQRFGVFLLRNTQGRIFSRQQEQFMLEEVTHLDTEQLAMAARIDMRSYVSGQGLCIELLHRNESEVSAYFSDWLAAETLSSPKEMTRQLGDLIALAGPAIPLSEEEGQPAKSGVAATKMRAYQHLRAAEGQLVDIDQLSQELYGSPAVLQDKAREHGIAIETGFRSHAPSLKQMVEGRASAEGFSLKFMFSALEEGLLFIEEDDHGTMRVVIESDALAKALLNAGNPSAPY